MAGGQYDDAWETPGWTAQMPFPYVDPEGDGPTGLPEAFDLIEIFGHYTTFAGRLFDGKVIFRCRARLYEPISGKSILPDRIDAEVKSGSFSVELPVSMDPDLDEPNSVIYDVEEKIPRGDKYRIEVPFGIQGPVNVSTLRVDNPAPPSVAPQQVTRAEWESMVGILDGLQADEGTKWFFGSGPPPEAIPGAAMGDVYLDQNTMNFYILQ